MKNVPAASVPMVDVAVVLIRRDDRILTVFNEKWGAFVLPMTKRRRWQDPKLPKGHREEDWEDAAIRAGAECTGRTHTVDPAMVLDVPEMGQSDRDGKWKRYHFQVFTLDVGEEPPAGLGIINWLTADEITDRSRRPISESTRHLIAELRLGKLV